MHGAPKCIRSCQTHPSRGTRYRPQPRTLPTPVATSPFSSPADPTHTYPFTKATQKPRHPRTHSASLSYTLPPDIGVTRAATPQSRYSNPTLHQEHLTQYVYGFRSLRDTPINGTHQYDDPGQPTCHRTQERATRRRAPSGSPTDSAAQRGRPSPQRFPTSHYSAATQRPAHKPHSNPRRHSRTPHPRDPTPLTGPRHQAAHSQSAPTSNP